MLGSTSLARCASRRRTVAVVSAIVFVGGSWATPAAAGGKARAADGSACTVVGTTGNDRLTGSFRNDVICGLGGNDTLTGNGGNDVLDGGAGNDSLLGGVGGDTFVGGSGTDTASYTDHAVPVSADLDGVADDGGKGERDRIMTDVENLIGGGGNDKLSGNSARNNVRGGAGDDVLRGGSGNDTLDGSTGNDKLHGDDGNDTMVGGPGADDLDGGTGDNSCTRDHDDISPENACSDTEAPVVDPASVTFVGQTTFTNTQDNIVTLQARVTDSRSGVEYVGFQLARLTPSPSLNDQGSRLVSGTRYDGMWEAKIKIPRYAASGEWHVIAIHTGDIGHSRTINRNGDGFYSSAQVPVPISLGAVTVTGDPDVDAPLIDTANLAWVGDTKLTNTVDNKVRVRAPITDAQSGVAGVYGWFGGDTTPSASAPHSHRSPRVSGTVQDGVWELSAVIPKYAPVGSWRLRQLCAYDELMNQTCYFVNPDGTYQTMDGTTGALALPALTLSGTQSDSTPPTVNLTSFKWHGDHQFHNNIDNVVILRADLADDLSGVKDASCALGRVGGSVVAGYSGERIRGTERDGTFEFRIKLPKFTQAGQYRLAECMFTDKVGNRSGLEAKPDGSYATLDPQSNMYTGPTVDIDGLNLIEMTETSLNS